MTDRVESMQIDVNELLLLDEIGKELDGLEYKGSYADAVRMLRQRVKELEVGEAFYRHTVLQRDAAWRELAALKAQQGEPVASFIKWYIKPGNECLSRIELASHAWHTSATPMLTEQTPCDIPEGYVLVPVKPTEGMLRFIQGMIGESRDTRFDNYADMLTAAKEKNGMSDKISLTLADLKVLAATAERNGTYNAFVDVTLSWSEQAYIEIKRQQAVIAELVEDVRAIHRKYQSLLCGDYPCEGVVYALRDVIAKHEVKTDA